MHNNLYLLISYPDIAPLPLLFCFQSPPQEDIESYVNLLEVTKSLFLLLLCDVNLQTLS